MFWRMGQIGSTMISVCAIGNTSWANWQTVDAVSDNIIIINCVMWPKEQTGPNNKLFGPMVHHMSLLKTLVVYICLKYLVS